MDARRFVEENRAAWQRLEELLDRAAAGGLGVLSPQELRELGVLHRQASADLALARSRHADSKVAGYLNRLALRSHNAVYRAPRRPLLTAIRDFVRSIPPAVRRHPSALGASALLFFGGVLLGAAGAALDESVADLVLGPAFTERVREGHYWIEDLIERVPGSALSGMVLTNNVWVALRVFAFGFTGVLAAVELFRNGLMLGAVFSLTGHYGLLPRFLPFVTGHGVIEISAIVVAGAGGFVMFDGWLHAGESTRLEGLRTSARQALRHAGAAVLALAVAGPVEGLISTVEDIPGQVRIALGIALGAVYWSWLLFGGSTPSSSNLQGPGRVGTTSARASAAR